MRDTHPGPGQIRFYLQRQAETSISIPHRRRGLAIFSEILGLSITSFFFLNHTEGVFNEVIPVFVDSENEPWVYENRLKVMSFAFGFTNTKSGFN